jgi:short-subunit dehydrogenase
VNTIGFFEYDKIQNLSKKRLLKNFEINTIPTILINKFLLKNYQKNIKRNVITIGSSSSYNGFKNTTGYCSSKNALLGAIRSINKENSKNNIFNININPSSIKNSMGKRVKGQNYNTFIDSDEIAEFIFRLTNFKGSFFIEDVWLKRSYN